jgi:hypothetical protein
MSPATAVGLSLTTDGVLTVIDDPSIRPEGEPNV